MVQCLRFIPVAIFIVIMCWLSVTELWSEIQKEAIALSAISSLRPGSVVLDTDSQVLRYIPSPQGDRCHPFENGIPPLLSEMVILSEDHNFEHHSGVDFKALLRASLNYIRYGKKSGGASTIAMQLIRILRPRQRNMHSKLIEIFQAAALTRNIGRSNVLSAYLDLVPTGNKIRGFRLASKIMYNMEASMIDAPRAALLASLLPAPGALSPYGGNSNRLKSNANRLLSKWPDPRNNIKVDNVTFKSWKMPFKAPHAVEQIKKLLNPEHLTRYSKVKHTIVISTIDMDKQQLLEQKLNQWKGHIENLGASQAAGIILNNHNASVCALSGSISWEHKNSGFVDGTLASRSAGSTLKPFLYGMAIESGMHPYTIIEDVPEWWSTPSGTYSPNNAGLKSHGPVSLRTALASSLNLPAAKLLEKIGIDNFYIKLKALGLNRGLNWKHPEHYGLGMAIGNIESTLINLAGAYSTLTRDGLYLEPALLKSELSLRLPVQIYKSGISSMILDMLSDRSARTLTFGNPAVFSFNSPVAVKTGTSTAGRDSWCVAVTPNFTIAVWAGNFDGRAAHMMTGGSGPGWIVNDIVSELEKGDMPWKWTEHPMVKSIALCPDSGKTPGSFCKNRKLELTWTGSELPPVCDMHTNSGKKAINTTYASWLKDLETQALNQGWKIEGASHGLQYPRIVTPLPDSDIILLPDDSQGLMLSARTLSERGKVLWLVDNVEIGRTESPHVLRTTLPAGNYLLTALGEDGTADSIRITVSRYH